MFTYRTTTRREQERMSWIGGDTYCQQLDKVESHVTHVSSKVVRVIAETHTPYTFPFTHSIFPLPFFILLGSFIKPHYIVCILKIHRFSEMNDGLKTCLRTNCVTAIISTRINSQLSIQSWKKSFHCCDWMKSGWSCKIVFTPSICSCCIWSTSMCVCECISVTMVECEHLSLLFNCMYLVMPIVHSGTACHICNIIWNCYLSYIKFYH